MKVIIIEKEEKTINLINNQLKKDGFTSIVQNYSDIKLEEIISEKPDLIIAGLTDEEYHIIELIKKIKQSEEIKDVPLIILSPIERKEEIMEALEHGATDFIKKPINDFDLSIRIKKFLKNN